MIFRVIKKRLVVRPYISHYEIKVFFWVSLFIMCKSMA